MRGTLILGILSFIMFISAKFGIAYLAVGGCEPWTTCYYVMIGVSFSLAFLAISEAFKGWKKYFFEGISGFFVGESINQYFHDGKFTEIDLVLYLTTPILFYLGGKLINKK